MYNKIDNAGVAPTWRGLLRLLMHISGCGSCSVIHTLSCRQASDPTAQSDVEINQGAATFFKYCK